MVPPMVWSMQGKAKDARRWSERTECVTVHSFVSFSGDVAMCHIIFKGKGISQQHKKQWGTFPIYWYPLTTVGVKITLHCTACCIQGVWLLFGREGHWEACCGVVRWPRIPLWRWCALLSEECQTASLYWPSRHNKCDTAVGSNQPELTQWI